MQRTILAIALGLGAAAASHSPAGDDKPGAKVKQRHFEFAYSGKVSDLPKGKPARVWLPLAQPTAEQDVVLVQTRVPGEATVGRDREYGNKILFFEAKANDAGEIPFELRFDVTRREVRTGMGATLKPAEDKSLVNRFLQPDSVVPVGGKPLELIKDRELPADQFQAAKVLYDVVNGHMKYSKEGKGWGRGDAVWACDSKFGNCTDFHSLFISMARGNKIPAKFEMGFPIPEKRGDGVIGGYHCWAWFMPRDKGWIPVDISEANRYPDKREYYFGNLSEDRVQFTTGRDIQLEPRQAGPALNYFIYPYAEVDGQQYPAEKVLRTFSYRDL